MEHVTDHASRALAREAQQLKGKPLWEGLLAAVAREVQEVEDALWGMVDGRSVALGVGAQLDGLGRIVGADRLGSTDAEYRSRLLAQIRLNVGSGTIPDIIAILSLVTGAGVEVQEPGVAELLVRLHGAVGDGTVIAGLLASARNGGVLCRLDSSPAADEDTLIFDAEPGLGDLVTAYSSVTQDSGSGLIPTVSGTDATFIGTVHLQVTTLGAPGTATFEYSLDGGSTWSADQPVTQAPSELGTTGIFVAWPGSFYGTPNTFHFSVHYEDATTGGKLASEIAA